MKRLFHSLVALSLFIFLPASAVVGQETLLPQGDVCGKCLTEGDCHLSAIPCYIKYIAQYIVSIVGTISVIMVMVGGYLWMMSGVNEGQKDKAKKTILYAIIGLIITLLSWVIVNFIEVTVTS